jgi:hypothetical protein
MFEKIVLEINAKIKLQCTSRQQNRRLQSRYTPVMKTFFNDVNDVTSDCDVYRAGEPLATLFSQLQAFKLLKTFKIKNENVEI